jgi:hypothetical protein
MVTPIRFMAVRLNATTALASFPLVQIVGLSLQILLAAVVAKVLDIGSLTQVNVTLTINTKDLQDQRTHPVIRSSLENLM